jgi:general secretion pathway protein L
VKEGKVEKTKENKVSFRLDIQVQCPEQPQGGEG